MEHAVSLFSDLMQNQYQTMLTLRKIVAPLCERRLTVSGLTAMAALRSALLVEIKLTIAAGRRTSAIS